VKAKSNRDRPIQLNSWLVPALVLIAIVTDFLAPYRGWRILFVGLGGALIVSWLWSRSLARGLSLTREMRFGWAQVGDRMVERFTLRNEGWAPGVWVEIHDESTVPGYSASRGTGVAPRDSLRWHTEAVCQRRGLFTLGPTQLRAGDPFGLFTVRVDFPATLPLLVLPPIVPLPHIQVSAGGHSGDARPRANAMDKTVSAASVREYASGDSRRWIHWRTTAKRNDLYVRMFDGTPAGDWWILLDMYRHAQIGEGQDATDEHGVILAASLADRGIRMRRPVGLVAFGQQLVWLPPAEGEGQRWDVLRALALVDQGDHPLEEVLLRVGPNLSASASLVIITPSPSTAWVEALLPLIRRGAVPTVLLLDPATFGGSGDTRTVRAALTNLGVSHYLISRELLNRAEARPGRQGQIEWRILGTGKAVPVTKYADAPWKVLE